MFHFKFGIISISLDKISSKGRAQLSWRKTGRTHAQRWIEPKSRTPFEIFSLNGGTLKKCVFLLAMRMAHRTHIKRFIKSLLLVSNYMGSPLWSCNSWNHICLVTFTNIAELEFLMGLSNVILQLSEIEARRVTRGSTGPHRQLKHQYCKV